MTYKTQPGTVPHRAVEYLKTLPAGSELSTVELADALDFDIKSLVPCLAHPRRHGVLVARQQPGGRALMWSLGDGTPPLPPQDVAAHDALVDGVPAPPKPAKRSEPPEPFRAAAWTDGSLIIVGSQIRPDGVVVLDAQQTMQVRRLVAWLPPA